MRGVGRATSAVTIVNALPTGVGGALGIDLAAEVTVEFAPTAHGGTNELRSAAGPLTPLLEKSFGLAVEKYLSGRSVRGEVSVRSVIPPARGLKSSSAVGSATIRAVAEAAGASPPPEEVARLSAEAGRAAGVSATGAFDDALAGVRSGLVLTNNRSHSVIRAVPPDPDWSVEILLPAGTHRPSPEWAAAFARRSAEGVRVVEAAEAGDWWEAMRRNTELVEAVMGYAYRPLRARVEAAGALACGVSGLGPALAAVVPRSRVADVRAVLARESGDHLAVAVSRAPSAKESAP